MQFPPPEVIASWPSPNYSNPTHVRGPELIIIAGIFFPLAFLTVAIRMFTRLRISRAFSADDVFLLTATIPAIGCAVLVFLTVIRWGWNRHIWDVPLDLITLGLKVTIAIEVSFGIAVSCTKISLLILTRRIMSSGTGYLRHVATIGIFVVLVEMVIFAIVVIFPCRPVQAYWTLSFMPQKCIDERIHLLFSGSINTLTDFFVFFLPIPTILGLKTHHRQRVSLCLLFGAGAVVCIAGVFRLFFTWKTTSTYDRTWASYYLWIVSVLELNVGIICASLPACNPFFSRYIPVLMGSSFHNSKNSEDFNQKNSPLSSHPRKPSFPKGESVLYETTYELDPPTPWGIPPPPISKLGPRLGSKDLMLLSHIDSPSPPPSRDSQKDTKLSTQTSISSFIAAGESTTPSICSFRAESPWHTTPWERDQAMHRGQSPERLSRGMSIDGFI